MGGTALGFISWHRTQKQRKVVGTEDTLLYQCEPKRDWGVMWGRRMLRKDNCKSSFLSPTNDHTTSLERVYSAISANIGQEETKPEFSAAMLKERDKV